MKEFIKTKTDERENIICSFNMRITNDHLRLTKLVAKGPRVSALRYIFLDPYNLGLSSLRRLHIERISCNY